MYVCVCVCECVCACVCVCVCVFSVREDLCSGLPLACAGCVCTYLRTGSRTKVRMQFDIHIRYLIINVNKHIVSVHSSTLKFIHLLRNT